MYHSYDLIKIKQILTVAEYSFLFPKVQKNDGVTRKNKVARVFWDIDNRVNDVITIEGTMLVKIVFKYNKSCELRLHYLYCNIMKK